MEDGGGRRRGRVLAALAIAVATAIPARANHTSFSFQVDRFEGSGNTFGQPIGPPEVDAFDDGALAPGWRVGLGTATEQDGFLFLRSPGTHFPLPDGTALDLSVAISNGAVYDRQGDFTAAAYWEPVPLEEGNHYHFSMLMGGGFGYPEAFGIGIQNLAGAFGIEQHLTVVDLIQGGVRDVASELFRLTPEQVTGQVVFRLSFDDGANLMTSSFSVDGGTTWASPFASVPVFGVHNYGQFVLSADPGRFAAGDTFPTPSTSSTTATSTSSSTTSTACVADGCTRGAGTLLLERKHYTSVDVRWKWRGTASLPVSETAAYAFCIADGTGEHVLVSGFVSRAACRGCWPQWTGDVHRYVVEADSDPASVRLVLRERRPGHLTAALVTSRGWFSARGKFAKPLTVVLRESGGACWAQVSGAKRAPTGVTASRVR